MLSWQFSKLQMDSHAHAPTESMNSYLEREKRKLEPVKLLTPWQRNMSLQHVEHSRRLGHCHKIKSKHRMCDQNNLENIFQWKNDIKSLKALQTLQFVTTMSCEKQNNRKQTNHKQNDLIPSGDVVTIMMKQNELIAALVHEQPLSLPPRDIPVFEGDQFQYKAFSKAFVQGVESKAIQADCLYSMEVY